MPSTPSSSRGADHLFDVSGLDLAQTVLTRTDLERWNAHRGHMAQLDGIVWHADDYSKGVAIKHVRDDEFWVDGHFPGDPIMPGVLMVEAGAQLANFLFFVRRKKEAIAGFTRIEDTVFRDKVKPGDDLLILCRDIKYHPRRFISDIQGLVDGRVVFSSKITGMILRGRGE